jgi:hypothetical protein
MVSRSCSPYSVPGFDISHAGAVARVGGQSVPHLKGVAGQGLRRGKGRRAQRAVGG